MSDKQELNLSRENESFLVAQFMRGLEISANMVQQLSGEVRELALKQATTNAQLETLKDNVTQLLRLVRDGIGGEALLSRMVTLETLASSLTSSMAGMKDGNVELTKWRRGFIASLVTSLIALVGTVLGLIFK